MVNPDIVEDNPEPAAPAVRDESLFYLFSPVTRIKGLGTATSDALRRLLPAPTLQTGGHQPIIRDLLFHLPVNLIDRRFTCPLNQSPEGVIATFTVKVDAHYPPPAGLRGKRPYKVECSNETGTLSLVFFHAQGDYIKQSLPVGSTRVVSGRTEYSNYHLQMTHPDVIAPPERIAEVLKQEPVYPLTVGLTSRRIAKYMDAALDKLPALPEWLDPEWVAQHQCPGWKDALTQTHHPDTAEDLMPLSAARRRLAYDEMLANQLNLAMLRRSMQHQTAQPIRGNASLCDAQLKSLPFKLTQGQQDVLKEIYADMESGRRMTRLLQGDVGSGKTIVALMSMLRVAEDGFQSALMVPTEIIAQQHYETLCRLTGGLPVSVRLLTGSVKGKARASVLADIAGGQAAIVVGTHALFQEHVHFKSLALAVIDEQHRFGVAQRMALTHKGTTTHLLHMTATPIPRSLTMTMYGDMDCSSLRQKPAGRIPITTRVIPLSRYDDVMARMKDVLDKGDKIYWICPLIEEKPPEEQLDVTAESDIAAAETRFIEFKERFGDMVGLVHGRMKADRRDEQMQRFAGGSTRLLVATTVVEVGVDVRDATIIVIEKAERFGLSQLHQLRGRVGRGDKPSSCVLLCSDRISETSRSRLSTLRDSEDGFMIAEADLEIRGGGDLLGSRQSGLPRFIFTHLLEHRQLLEHARHEAAGILAQDPGLTSARGKALRILMQLFA